MSGLLVQALKRVSGKDGEPVIQLKTAFGGGKTHSMLALYHLLRGMVSLDKIPTVRPVLEQSGLASLPKVHAAMLVGRMEAIWKPVAANEGFEVVRRRLFLDCKNESAKELVCAKFSEMYRESPTDFPLEAKEIEYKKRLLSCYPIHPEVFDRLYEDWATLERFQRTRGVLRLMAAVIHELWMGSDAGLLIMPGSLPMDVPNVRDELTRHLSEGWNALVDKEVDGKHSRPYQQDQAVSRYGKLLASRRVARTIMLGSAPTVRQQSVRGVEAARVRLGVSQPGESIAVFNDALNALQSFLAYLYTNPSADRFWYDTRPTLRKTVEDRATQVSESEVEFEIERRLKKLRREQPFAGVHICPASSMDVPDEQAARLVILRPVDSYAPTSSNCHAMQAAQEMLDKRGTSPRMFKNMLVFLAPDQAAMASLKQEVRRFLAWTSVKDDSQDLNLDAAQNRETENSLKRSDETVELRLKEAWCWLLVPGMDRADMKTLDWERIHLSGSDGGIIMRAATKLLQEEMVISKWAPALLRMELDDLLWRDTAKLQIKQLWEYLCTYCYLPRLADYGVLQEAIERGLPFDEYFAYAAGVGSNAEGEYFIDLKYAVPAQIDRSGFLVRVENAREQLANRQTPVQPVSNEYPTDTGSVSSGLAEPQQPFGGTPAQPDKTKAMHFFLSAKLDTTRINRDVQKILEEVISHLTQENGLTLEMRLEVQATAPNGVQAQTVRAVSENCRTLKISNFGFEEN